MSGSKFGPTSPLTVGRQRSSLRQTDEWSEDCESILSMLERSSAPRTRKDIQFEQMLGDNATLNRLEDLMNANDVRKRSDGPDGRLVYYEPTKTWHVSWGGEWGADIGLVGCLIHG